MKSKFDLTQNHNFHIFILFFMNVIFVCIVSHKYTIKKYNNNFPYIDFVLLILKLFKQ